MGPSSFQVITRQEHSCRTYGDLNQKQCQPFRAAKKSCSGTPSAQVDFAIKSYYGTPAVFDDPMLAAIAASIGPKFF